MSKVDLIRALAKQTERHERRLAEMVGRSWEPPVIEPPKRLRAIRDMQAERLRLQRKTLVDIMLDAHERREVPRPCEVAREMSRRLGTPFGPERLFRPALIEIWNPDADWYGKRPGDDFPGAAAWVRLSRRVLIHGIVALNAAIDRIDAERAGHLLRESETQDGWEVATVPAKRR